MSGCIFCDIVSGARQASVVYEDDATLAFMDLRQPLPGHVLVIPRQHVELIYELDDESAARLFQTVVRVARAVRASLRPTGMNVSQSNGPAAGQEVPHLHMHLWPREMGDGLLRFYTERPGNSGRDSLDDLAARIRAGLEAE
jgi:histidine triad (HIT) family protein